MLINSESVPKRIEGQIWIDKNSPNRLKYYVNGHEYTVEVSGNYPSLNPSTTEDKVLYCGTVVKLSNLGYLMEAKFPEDISDVLGIVAKTTEVKVGTTTGDVQIPITKNGWIVLSSNREVPETGTQTGVNELTAIFTDYPSDTLDITNYWNEGYWNEGSWADKIAPTGSGNPKRDNLIGAPVYWCLDEDKQGKLTLSTPSGFYWKKENNNANISYYNLPQIGNISKINYEAGDGTFRKIESVEIHVNFSKFDSSLEWSWPAVKKAEDHEQPISPNYLKEIVISHGFKINSGFNPQSSHHITGIEVGATKENEIIAEVTEDYSLGQCKISISNPYDIHYRVSGEVNFRVDMVWPSSVSEEPEP